MGTIAPELNDLVYFVQLAQTRSFTEAAERLGVPKSAVSRAIRRLESRLGVRLAERTTRRVTLTEVGQVYLNHCQRVMEEAEQADLAIGALLERPRGRLRVGAPVPFARYVLAPILGELLERYPELHIDLHLHTGYELPRDGSFDVLIRGGPLGDSTWLVRWLMRVRLGLYASPAYLERWAMPETPLALRQHTCVASSCDPAGRGTSGLASWRLRRDEETEEATMQVRLSVPDPAMILEAALAGIGVAVLAQSMARADVAAGRLVRLVPEWEPEPVELHALYPSRLSASPKVRAFLEFLREKAAQ